MFSFILSFVLFLYVVVVFTVYCVFVGVYVLFGALSNKCLRHSSSAVEEAFFEQAR